MSKLERVERMLAWLKEEGGYIHPSAVVRENEESGGLGLFTDASIPADERLISCPFSCAVTPDVAVSAISALYGVSEDDLVLDGKPWDERMLISAYIGLHWVWAENGKEWPSQLKHRVYVESLPDTSGLTTPLYFNEDERYLLEGTNLHGAVADLEKQWKEQSESLRSVLKEEGLTWDRYLAVQTFLTSRAFPSSLLQLPDGATETSGNEEEPHPVLLPGLDLLNHSRGVPILWLSSKVKTSAGDVPAISFILPNAIASGSEVFNNYGAKSNESLLLGYGFVIPDNPDDTVVLRLGGAPPEAAEALKAKGLDATKRFLVGTDGVIPQELLQVMRILIGSEDADIDMEEDDDDDEHAQHEKEVDSLNAELSVLEMLREMLDDKVEKIIEPLPKGMEARDNVEEMIETYRQGQVDILYSAIEHVDERVERVEKLLEEGPECACGC